MSYDVIQKYFKVICLNGTNVTLTSGTSTNSKTGMKRGGTETGGRRQKHKTHTYTQTNKHYMNSISPSPTLLLEGRQV